MPVQSPGEQPARPTPEAATPPPSLQPQLRSPTSFKSQRRSHAVHARAKRRKVWDTVFISFPWKSTRSLSVQVSLCVRLPLGLSGTSHSTLQPRSLQLYSTLTAWERRTQRKKRGRNEGVGGCYLVALCLCYLSGPLYDRFTIGNSWVYVSPRIDSLSLSLFHTDKYTFKIMISHTESRA